MKAAFPDSRIFIPPGQADAVRTWDVVGLTFGPTGQQCARFDFDGLLQPGQVIPMGDHTWEVHAARGHDPHSVVLFEPHHRVLISADALWENGFGVVFPELDDEDGFDDVERTLEVIRQLEPAWIIPGHGAVFCDLPGSLARAHSRLDQFRRHPDKHRRHALKVLVKFKLLEWQQTSWERLSNWFTASSYFARIAAKDTDDDAATVLRQLIKELANTGALTFDEQSIRNV